MQIVFIVAVLFLLPSPIFFLARTSRCLKSRNGDLLWLFRGKLEVTL